MFLYRHTLFANFVVSRMIFYRLGNQVNCETYYRITLRDLESYLFKLRACLSPIL